MATAIQEKIVRVRIDASGAQTGARNINQALASIGNTGTVANGSVQKLTMSLGGMSNAAQRTAANSNVASSSFGALGQSANAAMQRLAGMGGTLTGIGFAGAALGATAVAGALVGLGIAAVSASAQMQSYKASLSTVLGDAEKAAMAMDRLTQFAAKTPFSLKQSVEGFIQLKALGLQPTEAAMTSYGNTASAMGKDLSQMIEAVADATTGEFERLKTFGIKSKNEGATISFTFQGVKTSVKNNSQEIQKYLQQIGDVNFAGAMEKQMLTFNGAMSNLEDTWFQTMAAIGDGGLTNSVGRFINMMTNGLTAITPVLVSIGNAMGGLVDGVGAILGGIGDLFGSLNTGGEGSVTILENLTFHFNMIGQVAQVAGSIIGGIFSAMGTLISGTASILSGTFGGALEAVGIDFDNGSRSWSNSLFGVLRAAKAVAQTLPTIFQIAVNDLMGMFSTLGQAIGALLSGQWDRARELASKPLFTNTGRAIDAATRIGVATYKDEQGAANAMNRMLGRGTKKAGLSLDDLAGAAPKPPAPDADKDAAKKAADRAKREAEFWQSLKNQAVAAGMLANQAEVYNKQLDLRKILERDLNASEKERVAAAMAEINTAKVLGGLKQSLFEAQNEYTVELGRAKGLTDAQKSVEDALFKARLDALNKGVDINSIAYAQAEGELKTQLLKNAALKEQNALLAKATDFARKYSAAFDASFELKGLEDQRAAFEKAFAAGEVKDAWGNAITPAVREAILAGADAAKAAINRRPLEEAAKGSLTAQAELDRQRAGDDYRTQLSNLKVSGLDPEAMRRATGEITRTYNDEMTRANRLVADDFLTRMGDGITELADMFGGKFGEVLNEIASVIDNMRDNANGTSGMARMMSGLSRTLGEGFKAGADSMLDLKGGLDNIGKPLKGLKEGFDPAAGGSFLKGMGKAVGGAMQGYQMGSAIGDIGSMLGANEGFNKGAKIGGTIGGLTGNPIIAAGASVIGGLLGGLFYKPKYGTANLTGADPATLSGNKGSVKAAAGSAGEAVQKGLAGIAERLGGTVGAFSLSIGQFDGKWRVRDEAFNGKGGLNFKGASAQGLHDFGKDGAEAAIAYAISNALKDGAIQGISDFAKKALATLDVDAALSLVDAFNEITKELDAMNDPIGAAVRAINDPLNSLIERMKAVGASTSDLGKIEDYRAKKLEESLKSQVSSLNGFLDALKGEGSGISKVDRLNTDLAKFNEYQAKIKAGDSTVDQAAFTSLGQSIFGLAREVYGTSTSEFQDLRAMLINSTSGLVDNVTKTFNAAGGSPDVVSAVNAGAQASVAEQVITNALLRDLPEQLAALMANSGGGGGVDALGLNGRYSGKLY